MGIDKRDDLKTPAFLEELPVYFVSDRESAPSPVLPPSGIDGDRGAVYVRGVLLEP